MEKTLQTIKILFFSTLLSLALHNVSQAQTITITSSNPVDIDTVFTGDTIGVFQVDYTWSGFPGSGDFLYALNITEPSNLPIEISLDGVTNWTTSAFNTNSAFLSAGSGTFYYRLPLSPAVTPLGPCSQTNDIRLATLNGAASSLLDLTGLILERAHSVKSGILTDGTVWDTDNTPGQYSRCYVQSGHNVTVSANRTLSVLNVTDGGNLTISNGLTLTLNDSLIIQSGGSLLDQNTSAGLAGAYSLCIERYLATGPGYYTSIPVSSATSAVYDPANATDNNRLWYWDESANDWAQITNNSTNLTVGLGYAYISNVNQTLRFRTGTPNTGNVSVNVTHTGGTKNGWNLLGNPYPCAVDWDNEVALTRSGILNNTIYFRSAGSFYDYNANLGSGSGQPEIPAMQSVWVKVPADSTPASVTFTNDAKIFPGGAVSYYKKDKQRRLAKFKMYNTDFTDYFTLGVIDQAQQGFDKFDSEKYDNSGANTFSVFSVTPTLNRTLGISAQGPYVFTDTLSYPIYADLKKAGQYTLELFDFEDLLSATGYSVVIENHKTGQFTPLTVMNKTITLQADSTKGMPLAQQKLLTVHIMPDMVTGIDDVVTPKLSYFASGAEINAYNSNPQVQLVEVLDLTGRRVAFKKGSVNAGRVVYLNSPKGIYIVKTTFNNGAVAVQKVFAGI